ncbi:peroxiredoxin family protein [Pedobacter fastidiosus]|uniref:thioredoxin-dependent peroxiredoxin n=1 Tax=Pedobacter fastidiosus TaxID=2765361 RepID=A0ABR7KTX3_9SPHI|nr:peroxiredoxin family protein [Pedobacter fastidiosus]MBC6111512.1 AhpC/TSA family protein [Pedobacter fastidiosus]
MKNLKRTFILSIFVLIFVGSTKAQTGLKNGEVAPNFIAKDSEGKLINLKQLLKGNKSVVLFFYRGQWCPYCNKHIKNLQDSLQSLNAKGAYIVGVTPESDESISKTKEKTKASFSLVSDNGYKIMKAYKVDYIMEESLASKYKTYGIDVAKNNGAIDAVLPVPATYIIGKDGKIKFVQFDTDYKKRASVKEILALL